jgi:hypothetical protein
MSGRFCAQGGNMAPSILLYTVALFVGMSSTLQGQKAPAESPCAAQGEKKPSAQERIVQRDIQAAIDDGIDEWEAGDWKALSRRLPPDFTVRLLDGTTLNREQVIAGMRQDLASVLRIDVDRTFTRVECLTLAGSQATVYTKQQYVRTLPDRKDGSPHEVITSVRHREKWVYAKEGWVAKGVEEIEQGPTYLDGEPYDPR